MARRTSGASMARPTLKREPSGAVLLAVTLLVVAVCPPTATAWQNWDFYNINVTDWDPGARRGHSMHLWNNSIYLFGGRGNDINAEHIPRTYVAAELGLCTMQC